MDNGTMASIVPNGEVLNDITAAERTMRSIVAPRTLPGQNIGYLHSQKTSRKMVEEMVEISVKGF